MKYKVLVYPNITWGQSLEKDSYVIVIYNIIKHLSLIRSDLHWTLLLPSSLPLFNEFSNVVQLEYPLPSFPNEMRVYFDSEKLLKLLDCRRNDFDIVYSHLPEHTLQLKNLFLNRTNLEPAFIGYSHWTEFPEVTPSSATMMNVNFLGLAEMLRCGVNTQAQKDLILKHVAKTFNQAFVDKLDSIIEAQYLGCEEPEYDVIKPLHKCLIAFNHRPNQYKGYDWFLEQMDLLWKERKDFRVWVPLAERTDREYIIIGHNTTRREYLSYLRNCVMGVCCEQKHAGWSVSATDGMSLGVPYLFADTPYYKELGGSSSIYYEPDELVDCIKILLEEREDYSKFASMIFEQGKWSKRIAPFNETVQLAIDSLKSVKKPDVLRKMVKLIKKHGKLSKGELLKEMGMGGQRRFSRYRNALRGHPNIKITEEAYQYI